MPTLILSPDDVAKVVDKLPPTEERNRIRGNLRAALRSALPAITEAAHYRANAERTLAPLYETIDGPGALLGDDLYDETIGDVHRTLYLLGWAASVDESDWREGLATLTEWLS